MKPTRLSGWRRIANAAWTEPNDPQMYGILELDASPILSFVMRSRAASKHVTPTHLVGRAIAHVLHEVPDLNVRIVGDYAIPRRSVDVFFITSVNEGRDLTGVKVERADEKSAWEVAAEVERRSHAMKEGRDPDLARTKHLMDRLPRQLLHLALRLTATIAGDWDKSIGALGLERSPFGSAMLTSVGMLGLPLGFSPLMWMYKVPMLILVGEITDKPVVVDGQIVIRPILPVTASIDHRYADGAHLGRAVKALRAYLADPEAHEPNVPIAPIAIAS